MDLCSELRATDLGSELSAKIYDSDLRAMDLGSAPSSKPWILAPSMDSKPVKRHTHAHTMTPVHSCW